MLPTLLATSFLVGCKKVEPAPADIDALFHLTFDRFEAGSDEELAELVRGFDREAGAAEGFEPFDGTVTNLDQDAVAALGLDRDADLAPGVFLINDIRCGWDEHERLLVHPQQDEFHDSYASYERTYAEDHAAWARGEFDLVTWELAYRAETFIVDYSARTRGALRRVKALDAERSPFGDVIVGLTYMPEPAQFDGDGKSMLQDYHLEAFWERAGVVMHAYALWRQADWGSGFTSESEGIQRVALNALRDWDDDNEKACEDGGF